MEDGRSRYRVPRPPIRQLSIGKPFDGLSQQEKLYAHHMARYIFSFSRFLCFPYAGLVFLYLLVRHGMVRE